MSSPRTFELVAVQSQVSPEGRREARLGDWGRVKEHSRNRRALVFDNAHGLGVQVFYYLDPEFGYSEGDWSGGVERSWGEDWEGAYQHAQAWVRTGKEVALSASLPPIPPQRAFRSDGHTFDNRRFLTLTIFLDQDDYLHRYAKVYEGVADGHVHLRIGERTSSGERWVGGLHDWSWLRPLGEWASVEEKALAWVESGLFPGR